MTFISISPYRLIPVVAFLIYSFYFTARADYHFADISTFFKTFKPKLNQHETNFCVIF